jgi:glutamate N-acetyltransferase/amino-acid N-acetyltransferase
MIEPNMATMLVYILCDLDIDKIALKKCLHEAVNLSFNRISVDSDQSTSDTCFILSSKKVPLTSLEEFQGALNQLCMDLADDLVRNGEGTGHVMEVVVKGAPDDSKALGMARSLVNSPLTKTAIFGNDPNVGRIIQALGDYAGNHHWELKKEALKIYMGGKLVMADGAFILDQTMEDYLYSYLKECSLKTPCPGFPAHEKRVKIEIELGQGTGSSRVLGSDLSYEYVRENADYRS